MIRDEYNGRRRPFAQDPQTIPTRYDTKYIICGGSRKEMKYPLPVNDDEKKVWFEDDHYFVRHMWQSNFSSPIESLLKRGGSKILDVGCGTGTWLLEVAKDYPNNTFIGVDVEPKFPTRHSDNIKFYQMDLLEGLPFQDNTFDLVFARLVGDSFTEIEWQEKILRELIRLTKPGCWVEIMQSDSRFSRCGRNLEKWNNAIIESINTDGSICENFETWLLNENQFSKVQHEVAVVPFGTWANKIGEFGISYIRHLSFKMKKQLCKKLNMTEEEYDEMMKMVEKEYNENMTYKTFHRFIAQKKT